MHPTLPPLPRAAKSTFGAKPRCEQPDPKGAPSLSSRRTVPVPPSCFVRGFLLLLLLLPLPSPAHYYYDFILMQKRFHKRPLSLPRGAGPTPASLECSPAASRRGRGRHGAALRPTLRPTPAPPKGCSHRFPHTPAPPEPQFLRLTMGGTGRAAPLPLPRDTRALRTGRARAHPPSGFRAKLSGSRCSFSCRSFGGCRWS